MILMIWFDLYLLITLDSNIFMLRIVPFLTYAFCCCDISIALSTYTYSTSPMQ